jgi:flavoprotein
MDDLEKNFVVSVEKNSNTPFLAGALQLRKFDFLLIAPATSNTVAKIALGVADTMISNAAIMALKAFAPVYIMPVDLKEGITSTILPDGKTLKIRVRKEDAENVRKLTTIDGIIIIEKPEDIGKVLIGYLRESQNSTHSSLRVFFW